jgi:hypothetical protein
MREHYADQFVGESEFAYSKILYRVYMGLIRRRKVFRYLAEYRRLADHVLGCDRGQISFVRRIESNLIEQTA